MKEIDKWLSQYRKMWETRFNQLDMYYQQLKKRKNEQLTFDFTVDKTAKQVYVTKEFNAELPLVWMLLPNRNCLTNGGLQNPGIKNKVNEL
jgi:hypothetical protein